MIVGATSTLKQHADLIKLLETLQELKDHDAIKVAMLYGSFAKGREHCRSDIDIAIALSSGLGEREFDVIDRILMSSDRNISILRLDDEDESPLIVQESLKGEHMVEPDWNVYYEIADRALHESESIRTRRQSYVAE